MPFTSLLQYAAFALLTVLVPGIALQRALGVAVQPALVVPLGTGFCAGAYWLSCVLGQPLLFPALVGVAALLLGVGGRFRLAPGPSLRGALPPSLAVVLLLAATQFPFNRGETVRGSDGKPRAGDFLLDPLVTSDSAFHVGVAHELVIGYPPQVPGVSGFPLGYHLGTDLVRAAALRWAGVDPWDSLTRFDVTMWAVALVLALRALAFRLRWPPLAVTLAPWTLLLTDFSFVFAGNPQAHWWADLLRGNLLLSLAYANPVVPALGLALGSLLALSTALDSVEPQAVGAPQSTAATPDAVPVGLVADPTARVPLAPAPRTEVGTREPARPGAGSSAAIVLAALLAGAVPFFKVFLGAQLLLGLGVAFLLCRPAARRALAIVAVPCTAATAGLVLGQGGQTVNVGLAPLDLAAVTRETLGLAPLAGAALAGWSVPWLLGSLGLRVLALPAAVRSLRGGAVASALAAMALSGWPLGLLFRVSAPEVLEGQKFVNDAAYLVEQSGPLLWLFAALVAARFAAGRRGRVTAVVLLALLLATPSTLQYALQKRQFPPARLPAPMVRAMLALERVSQPGDVVLQRPGARYPPAPVVLAGRRVAYERFTPYLTQFASRQALETRHELVYRFFRTRDPREASAIARSLDARFLALYGNDRVRFDTTRLLESIYDEEGARLYRFTFDSR